MNVTHINLQLKEIYVAGGSRRFKSAKTLRDQCANPKNAGDALVPFMWVPSEQKLTMKGGKKMHYIGHFKCTALLELEKPMKPTGVLKDQERGYRLSLEGCTFDERWATNIWKELKRRNQVPG